jgi:hypothetical protein
MIRRKTNWNIEGDNNYSLNKCIMFHYMCWVSGSSQEIETTQRDKLKKLNTKNSISIKEWLCDKGNSTIGKMENT